jgi:hypothetical protein
VGNWRERSGVLQEVVIVCYYGRCMDERFMGKEQR